jgi:hypothetical protein
MDISCMTTACLNKQPDRSEDEVCFEGGRHWSTIRHRSLTGLPQVGEMDNRVKSP